MPQKILMVLYYYYPYVSGLTIVAQRLSEALAARGHQVTVITSLHEANLPEHQNINGVDVFRQKILFRLGKGVFAPGLVYKTVKLAREHDIVMFHMPIADPALSSLFIPKNKIISIYQCDLNLGAGFIKKMVEKISFWLMDILLCRSKSIVVITFDYFKSCKFARYFSKAVAIYPPVEINKFPAKQPLIERKLYIIGFVGRIVEEKGLQYLFAAIPYLEKSIKDFEIQIVGDYNNVAGGSIYYQLAGFVEKYKDRIVFKGKLSDSELVSFYQQIDLLVLPSVDPLEAFGLVQIEAMLCGTPVVASDLPGVRDPVLQSGYGLLAKPKDARDLAEKIIFIYQNGISVKNSNYYHEFSVDTVIDEYEKLF